MASSESGGAGGASGGTRGPRPLPPHVRERIYHRAQTEAQARAEEVLMRNMWREATRAHFSQRGETLPPGARGPYLTKRARAAIREYMEDDAMAAQLLNAHHQSTHARAEDAAVHEVTDAVFNEAQASEQRYNSEANRELATGRRHVESLEIDRAAWEATRRNTEDEAALAAAAQDREAEAIAEVFAQQMGVDGE